MSTDDFLNFSVILVIKNGILMLVSYLLIILFISYSLRTVIEALKSR